MNKKRSRFIALFTALTLVASLYHVQPVRAAETVVTAAAEVTAAATVKTLQATAKADEIQKYGNVVLSLTCDEIKAAGYVYGDTVKVKFLGQTLKLPFVSNYSDVDSGKPAILARSGDPYVLLAINMGDFATKYGIAVKTVFEDNTFKWDYAEGITGPVSFTISLKKAGGYYEEYVLHQLSYSKERTDYPKLDDEEYANFRPIKTTGIGEGILYRTSSPINPKNNRNTYADAALKKAGVTVIVNLADDEETAKGYAGFDSSYYSTTTFTTLNMPVSLSSDEFKDKLAKGLKFMAKNPGIYAIHCTEGKDRAGFVSAILECLMGASYDEVIEDYMTTFYNYYGVKKGDKRYDAIVSSNIAKSLKKAFTFGKKDKNLDLKSANLASRAKKYLKSIGLTNSEIKALKKNLSQSADIGTVDTKATILSAWNDDAPAKKSVKKGRTKKTSKKSGKKKVTNRSKKAASDGDETAAGSSSVSHKVYFRENTANATPSGEKKISEIADEMTVDPSVTVTITGYASTSEPEPQALAESRSNYIADKFVEEYSIDASRINTRTSVSDTPQSIANVEISKK